MVRGETEIKTLDIYLQAFFDSFLVFQLDFKLDAVAILRFKENMLQKIIGKENDIRSTRRLLGS